MTSGTVEEPETTVPASQSALVVAGMAAVDVPPTILDAFEEDLAPSTRVTEVASPSVRVEVASSLRVSTDRVAEVATLTPGRESPVEDGGGSVQMWNPFCGGVWPSREAADDVSNSTQESDTDSFDWVLMTTGQW